jgi:hypothetical protein
VNRLARPVRCRASRGGRARRYRPGLEALEERWLLATISWTGAAGDGLWSTADNWTDPNGNHLVPGSQDDVVFNGGATASTVDSAVTVGSLTIQGWGGTLNVNGSLSVAGDLNVPSAEPKPAAVFRNGPLTVAGNVNLQAGGIEVDSNLNVGGQLSCHLGGSLSGTGIVDVTGQLVCSDVTDMGGAGTTVVHGGMSLSGVLGVDSGRTLVNAGGTAVWNGLGVLSCLFAGTFNNQGTFEAQPGFTFEGTGTFNNSDTFINVNSPPGVPTFLGGTFNNSGTVEVSAGTLSLAGGGPSIPAGEESGTFNVEAGAQLNFDGNSQAPYILDASVTLTGAGQFTQTGGAVTVNGAVSAPNYQLTSGDLNGPGTFTVQGLLSWSGGSMSGAGVTNAAGGLSLGGSVVLNQRTLNNPQTATWTGTRLQLQTGPTINNTGTWNSTTDQSLVGTGTFNNQVSKVLPDGTRLVGTLDKSGGTGTTFIDVPLNNQGFVTAQSGTLALRGGGTSSNDFIADAGGVVQFDEVSAPATPTFHLQAGTSLAGDGLIRVAGGEVSVDANVSAQALELAGGTLDGHGTLTVNGLLTWSGGAMDSTTASEAQLPPPIPLPPGVTNANAGLKITGDAEKDLGDRIINNARLATWDGAGNIQAAAGAVFNNLAGGTFVASSGALFTGPTSGTATFANAGMFTKVANTGTTALKTLVFNNQGQLQVQANSTLGLDGQSQGGGRSTGQFFTDTGGVLAFQSGTCTFDAGTTFTGPGLVQATAAQISITSTASVQAANFELDGGQFGGAGTFTTPSGGLFTWTGGAMTGIASINIAAGGELDITGSSAKTLDGPALNNAGTTVWEGTGNINAGSGTVVTNQPGGTFQVASDQVFAWDGNFGLPSFNNQGTFIKSAGTGTTAFQAVPFTNTGAVHVHSGSLQVGEFNNAGSLEIVAGSTVSAATYSQGGAGVLAVSLANGQVGRLSVSGAATLAGNLLFSAPSTFLPNLDDRFQILTFGSLTGGFTSFTGLGAGTNQALLPVYSATDLTLVTVSGAVVSNVVDGRPVTLAAAPGVTLAKAAAVANPSPGSAPAGVAFPFGFFNFTVQGLTPGGSTTVTLELPAGVNASNYYQFGPTPDNPTPHWYSFLFDGTTGAQIQGSVITLHFVDGQRGDADLLANGQIQDPGAPAVAVLPSAPAPSAPPPPAPPQPPPQSPITLAVAGSRLVVSTRTGEVLLSIRLSFGNDRLVNALVVMDSDGLPDVVFVLQDKHSHKRSMVRLDGDVLLRIAGRVGGRPNSTMAAVLEPDGFLQVLVGTDPRGRPVLDIFSGRTGNVLRQFNPFPPGVQGTVHLSMAAVTGDGRLDLVVTDPKSGQTEAVVFDGRTLLAPLPRVLP